MKIVIVEHEYPRNHKPADAESERVLLHCTGHNWIPWPWLELFAEFLAALGVQLTTVQYSSLPVSQRLKY